MHKKPLENRKEKIVFAVCMVTFGVLMAALVAWVQANQRDNQIAAALNITQLMAVQEVQNLGAAMDGAHTVTLAGQNGYNIEGPLAGVNGASSMVFVPFAAAWERPDMAGFEGILLLDTTGTTVQMGQSSSAPTFANNTIPQHDFAQRGVIDDPKYAAIYTHVPVFSDQISAVGVWNQAAVGPAGATSAVFLPLVFALTGLVMGIAVMSIGQGATPKSALDADLMRDFHHQIKNNLQLISSIIRMHSRETDNAEIKDVFLRLQDRVASLATLHQDHVRDDGSGQIDIAAMLHEVIDRSERNIPHGQDTGCVERDFGPVSLTGVQAAPLCMLVSDAVTDLLRGQPQPDSMRVSLVQEQAGTCVLTLAHSGGRAVKQAGIGAQLTEAFAIQLGGTIVRGLQPGNQTSLTVTFTPH